MGVMCAIKFENNPSGIFFSGQTLTGIFELRLDKSTKIKTITLTVRGTSKCQWAAGSGNQRRHYEDRENYFESKTTLLDSGELVSVPMGIQSYNFACALPMLIPSSFEGKHGYIRYQISVIVERPWKMDHNCLVNFSVINQYDLNTVVPSLRNIFEKEQSKTFCCGPCQSGELKIRLKVPRTAFIPGESIDVEVNVQNDSGISVFKINLYLKKRIIYRTFTTRLGEKHEMIQLCKESLEGVPSFTAKHFQKHVKIPAVIPTNTGLCNIIGVEYILLAYAKTACGYNNISLVVPLVIGTIGYSDPTSYDYTGPITTQPYRSTMQQHHQFGFAYQGSLPQFTNINTEPSYLPPSYEETVYGQKL